MENSKGKALMIQGTGSEVGKSVITSGFARAFARDGYRVAPFKSQNMALNSSITKKGKEIGRAQAVQAEAAMVEPTVDMNPVLLKPNADDNSQVIFRGRPHKNMSAKEYFANKDRAEEIIEESLQNLLADYQVVVMEGAGSPAEINLRDNDLVNMRVAEMADAPVILVADIDKGGVFASIVGTLELLKKEERERIKGIIINKFRGDKDRFKSGVHFIEKYTGKPVLGVIPYAREIKLPDEDRIVRSRYEKDNADIEIAIIYLEHISNFTDFDYFSHEPGVRIRYIKDKERLGNPDLVIIPGSKNTIGDLLNLYNNGLARSIKNMYQEGTPIIGICGGFQMLGEEIKDPEQIETERGKVKGLGLLDMNTVLAFEKITSRIRAEDTGNLPFSEQLTTTGLEGYEIHQGRTETGPQVSALFQLSRVNSTEVIRDGAINRDGLVWGTYIHNIFKNDSFRRALINHLRRKKGLGELTEEEKSAAREREKNYDKFAALLRTNVDIEKVYNIVFGRERA